MRYVKRSSTYYFYQLKLCISWCLYEFDEQSQIVPQSEWVKHCLKLSNGCRAERCWLRYYSFWGLCGRGSSSHLFFSGKKMNYQRGICRSIWYADDWKEFYSIVIETPSSQRLYHFGRTATSDSKYYSQEAEKLALEAPHFICSEQDPRRVILANKICRELSFVYQCPDPYLMLFEKENKKYRVWIFSQKNAIICRVYSKNL